MSLTQRQQDELELARCERTLADITDSGRQVPWTAAGRQYRNELEFEIARLRDRLAAEPEAA